MATTKKPTLTVSSTPLATGMATSNKTTLTSPTTSGLGSYQPTATTATTSTASKVPTYTSEIQQPDKTTTAYVTNMVYQNLMGRDATQKEIDAYHQQFTEYAKTHPIYTREATYDPTTGLPYVAVRDITAQKNPLAEQDFITNIVRQGPQSQAYQAATGYMDAMSKAMQQFGGGF